MPEEETDSEQGAGDGRGGEEQAEANFTIVAADSAKDSYADSEVPGEFRRLTEALDAEQVAITLIRVPPYSDFEQGTGHRHEQIEELYLVTEGTLTMRFGDEVHEVGAGNVVRVGPGTVRSHRNEGPEPVEMWAISKQVEVSDSVKVDDFWEPSEDARQTARDAED